MSNISNVHQFSQLNKDSKALAGQRLVRLIAKADKNGKYPSENLTESLCVSIPHVSQDAVAEVIDKLLPHVVGLVKDAQDKIIREWRIEHGRNEIPEDVFSVEQVVAWLDANAAGDRVSMEYLQEWFAEEYAAIAGQWIADQLQVATTSEVVQQKVNVIRDMFAGWSSPRYNPNIPQLKAMLRFGAVLGDSMDGRMAGYLERAQQLLVKKEAELASDALGF